MFLSMVCRKMLVEIQRKREYPHHVGSQRIDGAEIFHPDRLELGRLGRPDICSEMGAGRALV